MVNAVTRTPPDLSFEARPMRPDWPDDLPRYWYRGEAFATHYLNALSLLFPHGEKFFIDAVRAYRERNDDPRLDDEIRAFIGQEGWHRSVHSGFNAWLARLGLPAEALEARQARKIAYVMKRFHPRGWLAATVCLEHFTAIFAKDLLAHPDQIARMHPHFQRIWTWHAMEELEHKSVAFDLFEKTGGRYGTRVKAMLFVSFDFALETARNVIALLRADGQLWNPRVWWQAVRYFFGRDPGVFWKTLGPWLAFFRRDFHPWKEDDRALIRSAGDQLALGG
jgi:predicted metal-dependent hydrolase